MAGIDPTIPLGGMQQQQQQNPMQSLGQTVQMLGGLQTLRQNQMQLQANQVFSDAYKQSVNSDGSVDFNKLQSLAAQGGAGAFLPQFMGQVAQQRNLQQTYDTAKLDMALKQQQGIRQMIGSLAIDPQLGQADMTQKIASQISNAVQAGILPADQGIREIKQIPTDPKAQAGWIQNHLMSSLTGEQQLMAMQPESQTVDTGSGTVLLNRNKMTGQVTPVATVQKGLSPAELSQPVDIIGPDGTKRSITKQQWLQMQGQQQEQASPGVPTALSPADTATNEASGKQLSTDLAVSSGYASRIFGLNSALTGLQNATTGGGSEAINNIKSALTTLGVPVPGGVDSVKSYDEANKYLTQYAMAQAEALGASTDSKIATTLTGNASTHISNLAAQDVVRAAIGMEQMKQAQLQAFRQSGLPAAQYQEFARQFNAQVNPSVFVWDNMGKEAKQKYYDSLNDQQRSQFREQYNIAAQNGWIGQNIQSSQAPAANKGQPPIPILPQQGGQ